jgi:hypothetical protein
MACMNRAREGPIKSKEPSIFSCSEGKENKQRQISAHKKEEMMSAAEAAELADRRKVARESTIESVCAYIMRKVSVSASMGHRDTFASVPAFVSGVPQYDHGDMVIDAMAYVSARGYFVMSLGQGNLYISWRYAIVYPPPYF